MCMAWQAGRRVGWGPTRRKHYQLCFSLLSLWFWPFDMPDPHTAQSPSPIRIARRFRPGGNEETGHQWHPFTLGHGAQDGIEGVINLFAKK